MCTKSALLYPTDRKDFLKKEAGCFLRKGEKDSLEMWHVFAHIFQVPEAMTGPLSKAADQQ